MFFQNTVPFPKEGGTSEGSHVELPISAAAIHEEWFDVPENASNISDNMTYYVKQIIVRSEEIFERIWSIEDIEKGSITVAGTKPNSAVSYYCNKSIGSIRNTISRRSCEGLSQIEEHWSEGTIKNIQNL